MGTYNEQERNKELNGKWLTKKPRKYRQDASRRWNDAFLKEIDYGLLPRTKSDRKTKQRMEDS